jgi:geranylgeranyl transferase type-2 subunit beta
MSYLVNLTLRLAAGAQQLPASLTARHKAYLAAAQQADGGFAGRRGTSDLYYTGFAVRGLALVGGLSEEQAARVAGFLRTQVGQPVPPVDFLSLVFTALLLETLFGLDVFAAAGVDRTAAVRDFMARYRRPDGGYAKSERAAASSTYGTFLVAGCLELLGLADVPPPRMVELVLRRRRPDGGFVELEPMTQSGTNPTAAAIGLLRMCNALEGPVCAEAAGFLGRMQGPEGGLRAHDRIPMADLLSTFTGLVALDDLQLPQAVDRAAAVRYAEALALPDGGFLAGAWDNTPDVEYTFYGLATLALGKG